MPEQAAPPGGASGNDKAQPVLDAGRLLSANQKSCFRAAGILWLAWSVTVPAGLELRAWHAASVGRPKPADGCSIGCSLADVLHPAQTFTEHAGSSYQRSMIRPHYLEALDRLGVLPELAAFDPHVVGTPPLGLDLPASDIDVVCFAPDPDGFTRAVWNAFGTHAEFRMWQRIAHDRPVVASFAGAGWTIELFGQASPVSEQYGWRHFVVEQRLLALGTSVFRDAVMAQRSNGMKTEPAFAALLGLVGDPYQALLSLEACSDTDLTALLVDKGFK
ncbi:DUF4269 domain-containing protein [Blastomonas fulva]